eukprot:TRINITY_DN4329_c0_g1_i1.p1 TRINITY_DN4329_c0_g1~~TRINITY_DN4329_c0_g1_i1.p1  ORF type:complete len:652 (-),score=199.99 TRINITY_DN4329_c0_g1_i1:25-1980(-)
MDDSDEDLVADDAVAGAEEGEPKEEGNFAEEGEEEAPAEHEEGAADDREVVPGGWTKKERRVFLQKVKREEPSRENEREERLQALVQVRELSTQLENCSHLWEDIEVRNALLDAMEPPNPERGKSIYVEDGPPDNDPFVRAVATGVLVHLCFDKTVIETLSQDTKLRELIVEALQQVEPLKPPDPSAEEDVGADATRDGPAPIEPTPAHIQSRSQYLLAVLTVGYEREKGVCAKAIARPRIEEEEVPPVHDDDDCQEENAEEEELDDDEVVDPDDITWRERSVIPGGRKGKRSQERDLLLMSDDQKQRVKQRKAEKEEERKMEEMARQAEQERRRKEMEEEVDSQDVDSDKEEPEEEEEEEGDVDVPDVLEQEEQKGEEKEESSEESEEIDPDTLLAEVEDILYATKPSADEDMLMALCASADPLTSEEELLQTPPWRPGAALARRLDGLWSFAATRLTAESNGLWRFEQVREVLLKSAEVSNPERIRISALGTLSALLAFDENKRPMWEEPRLQKVVILGAASQVAVAAEGVDADEGAPKVMTMQPQSTELRSQALICLASAAAGGDDFRQAMWADARIVAALRDAAETSGPLQPLAVSVIRELTQSKENQDPMIDAGIPKLMGQILARGELLKSDSRACEMSRDRLLAD